MCFVAVYVRTDDKVDRCLVNRDAAGLSGLEVFSFRLSFPCISIGREVTRPNRQDAYEVDDCVKASNTNT